jgi:hypothetical protein
MIREIRYHITSHVASLHLRLNTWFSPLHTKPALQLIAGDLDLIFEELQVPQALDIHWATVFAA